jgi:hypothetical protein
MDLIGSRRRNVKIQVSGRGSDMFLGERDAMAKSVYVIGVAPTELPLLHSLVGLLRHPDPNVGELTRQALLYLETAASQGVATREAVSV